MTQSFFHSISAAMINFGFFLIVLSCLYSNVVAYEKVESHILPRPLILEYPELIRLEESKDELRIQCDSWRVAGEANNLSPWKTIPAECAGYVKDYMMGKGYGSDIDMVSKQAEIYAKNVKLGDDGKDAWIFDIDETLLSNLPYYVDHGYGLEVFDSLEFDKWVERGEAPAIASSLDLYKQVLGLGYKVFLLTGRSERQRGVTVENLKTAGFRDWDKLILRAFEDHEKSAVTYKSEKRSEMVQEGYRIVGNSGDQWSDLLGSSNSNRSFKLPNSMYYIA